MLYIDTMSLGPSHFCTISCVLGKLVRVIGGQLAVAIVPLAIYKANVVV